MQISVVIPFRNRADFLPRTLRSVAAQTHRPLEVLLVDNGSTDDSAAICHDFITEHSATNFCISLLSEKQPGAARARNLGLAHATSPYVYFFDSDDEMSPDFLSDIHKILLENEKIDIAAAPTRMIFSDGSTKRRWTSYGDDVSDQILGAMLSTQSVVVRTDFLRRIGGWDARLSYWDDWELGIRLLLARPHVQWLREKTYHRIYQHPDSITGEKFSDRLPGLRGALETAERLVCNDRRALLALQMRRLILAAALHREGDNQAATLMKREALKGMTGIPRFVLQRLFYPYCHFVGKAAWRIARWLLPLLLP